MIISQIEASVAQETRLGFDDGGGGGQWNTSSIGNGKLLLSLSNDTLLLRRRACGRRGQKNSFMDYYAWYWMVLGFRGGPKKLGQIAETSYNRSPGNLGKATN